MRKRKMLGLGLAGIPSYYYQDVPDTRFQRVLAFLNACAPGRSAVGGSSFRDFWSGRVKEKGYREVTLRWPTTADRSLEDDKLWLVHKLFDLGYLLRYSEEALEVWCALIRAEQDMLRRV